MKTHEEKIEQILSTLSLEGKVGQMTQIMIDALGKGDGLTDSYIPFEFDPAALDLYITRYKIGSVLNVPNYAIDVGKWQHIIDTLQRRAMTDIGIPIVYGIDSMHGATYTAEATLFPQSVTLGATFNREITYLCAKATAYETRASAIPWNFAPVLDLGRDPRWSRMWESYGEDSYLVSEMGVQAVRGFQGDDPDTVGKYNVAACLKHYIGYGVPVSGRDRTPAVIAVHELREKHFAPFLEAVRGGALSVMVNSGSVNGIPTHCDHQLLTVWLKEQNNWDGVIVTDWTDIDNLFIRERVARDRKDAIRLAVNAGIDMSMVPYDPEFCDLLVELVREGSVPMQRIDDAVRRILRLKLRLGLFDNPIYPRDQYPELSGEKFRRISYRAAAEAITLLKNDMGVLPLKKEVKILVCGPNADSVRAIHGGWSYSWQGNKSEEMAPETITFRKAIENKFGHGNVSFVAGVEYLNEFDYRKENTSGIAAAVKASSEVDVVILCIGENSYCETPGNLDDLYLSDGQTELAQALIATGKPIVVVLNEGRPRLLSRFERGLAAVVQTYIPGPMGGMALADVLAGDVNPAGKLPYTYPRYPNNLSTYDYKCAESQDKVPGAYDYDATLYPQWGFGHGLSYTTFRYSDLRVGEHEFGADNTITIEVDVTNTGARKGEESVLLFVSDQVASLVPDNKRLRGFGKIELEPGQTKTVTFRMMASQLAFVSRDGTWMLEQGEFVVSVGGLSTAILCTETKRYNG